MFKNPFLGIFLAGMLYGMIVQTIMHFKTMREHTKNCLKQLEDGEKIIMNYCAYYKNLYEKFTEDVFACIEEIPDMYDKLKNNMNKQTIKTQSRETDEI
jgi:hypothetical protein